MSDDDAKRWRDLLELVGSLDRPMSGAERAFARLLEKGLVDTRGRWIGPKDAESSGPDGT